MHTAGTQIVALVAGLSIDYIDNFFSAGLDETMFYNVIRRNGEIVIQN